MEIIGPECEYEYGELQQGYFYELDVPLYNSMPDQEALVEEYGEGVIFGNVNSTDLYAEVNWDTSRDLHGCSLNRNHVTGYVHENMQLVLFGGSCLPSFICDCSGFAILIAGSMKRSLMASTLTGFVLSDVLPIVCNQSEVKSPEIYMLHATGLDCTRPLIRQPPIKNLCPYCGWGPVVCPECFHRAYSCERCGRRIIVAREDHGGDDDPRFSLTPRPENGLIIEGRDWDGSEFLSGGDKVIVTKSAVDWLLKLQDVSFVATPCRVDVTGMSDSQRKALEMMLG